MTHIIDCIYIDLRVAEEFTNNRQVTKATRYHEERLPVLEKYNGHKDQVGP